MADIWPTPSVTKKCWKCHEHHGFGHGFAAAQKRLTTTDLWNNFLIHLFRIRPPSIHLELEEKHIKFSQEKKPSPPDPKYSKNSTMTLQKSTNASQLPPHQKTIESHYMPRRNISQTFTSLPHRYIDDVSVNMTVLQRNEKRRKKWKRNFICVHVGAHKKKSLTHISFHFHWCFKQSI
jgi:hypothetical protein